MDYNRALLVIILSFILIGLLFNILKFVKRNISLFNFLNFTRKNVDATKVYGERKRNAQILEEAVLEMARKKIGCLIAIEKNVSMNNYAASGVKLNADLNKYLLIALFSCKITQLHDGAVIVRRNKIICASAYFPMMNKKLSVNLGSRHRASLQISNITDCFAIVTSETSGSISYAKKGKLKKINDTSSLYKIIFENIK